MQANYLPLGIRNISRAANLPHPSKPNSIQDLWELLPSDIVMGDLLGEGAFGEVYRGFLTEKLRNNKVTKQAANTVIAVKILKGI